MNLIPIIQKYFKEGDKLYSMIHGWVVLIEVQPEKTYPIITMSSDEGEVLLTGNGTYFKDMGECILFPDTKKSWDKYIKIEDGDAIVYWKDEIWHLGRAAKEAHTGKIGAKQPNGEVYFPEKMINAKLFDFNNFENMKL